MSKGVKDSNSTDEKIEKIEKNKYNKLIQFSFYITFIFLTTTGTITLIEALRTPDTCVRHIMNLETCISFTASYFYYNFISKINEYNKENKQIVCRRCGVAHVAETQNSEVDKGDTRVCRRCGVADVAETRNSEVFDEKVWEEFTLIRYFDWSITTPFMLLSLCLFLGYNVHIPLKIYTIIPIWILNYIMLYFGFLGEIGNIGRLTACIAGFIPFIIIMYIIFITFIKGKKNVANNLLFILYFIIWSLYGIVYLFSHEYKNIITNILDLISKCLIGLGMWAYYVKIISF